MEHTLQTFKLSLLGLKKSIEENNPVIPLSSLLSFHQPEHRPGIWTSSLLLMTKLYHGIC